MQYRGKAALAAAIVTTTLSVAAPAAAGAPAAAAHAPARQAVPPPPAGTGHTLPRAAVAPISRILGHDEPGYLVSRAGGELVAHDSRQHLTAVFGPAGVTVRSGGVAVGLRLAGYGYGRRLRAVRLAAPVAHANRVTYRGRGLAQWFANGPAGLEQGFTVTTPPAGVAPHGPLTLALATSGGARASAGGGGALFRRGGSVLAYRDLVITDARGRRLHAWLTLAPGRVLLHAGTAGARYPLTVDPVFQQLAKLTASDGNAGANFGEAVAIYGDTVAVGAPYATIGSTLLEGAVYVFTQPAGGWADATQTAKLTASDGGYGYYVGISVAIDHGVIVAGAAGGGASGGGAAYVFDEPNGGWTDETQTAELTASDGAGADNFGTSVAINGHTIVAGAFFAQVSGHHWQGAAYVFTEPAGGWASEPNETETAKLTASDGAANDVLGTAVAVSGDTVVAGAPGYSSGQGAVYVYVEPGGGWASETQTAELTAIDGSPNDSLGSSVALSQGTVVAGAPGKNSGQGAAYIYAEPGGGWASLPDEIETAELNASDGATNNQFGTWVAISGNTVVVGSPMAEINSNIHQGALYLFTEPGTGWADETESAKLTAADGATGDRLGYGAGIYGDTIVGGALDAGANGRGAAYVFGLPAPPPPPPSGLRLAGFLSPRRGTHVRAGSRVTVTTRVDYADGHPVPGWLAAQLAANCQVTVRASGAQSTATQCMRWNAATHRFSWAWKTHAKPTGRITLTVTLADPEASSLSERLVLTAAKHRSGRSHARHITR